MSKTCEIKPYILKLDIPYSLKEEINNKHNEFVEELKSTKAFDLQAGKLFQKKFETVKSINTLAEFNKRFPMQIASFIKDITNPNVKYISLNVLSLYQNQILNNQQPVNIINQVNILGTNTFEVNGEIYGDYKTAKNQLEKDNLYQINNNKVFPLLYSEEIKTKLLDLKSNLILNGTLEYIEDFPIEIYNYFKFLYEKFPNKNLKEHIDYIYNQQFKSYYYNLMTQPIDTKLEDSFLELLNTYNITLEKQDKNILASKYNVNILGVFDIINKVVEVANDDQRNLLTIPEEIGHVVFELLGSNYKNKESRELYKLITKWEGYNTIYNEYKNIYKDKNNKTVDWKKIQKEAIGKAIGIAFIKYNKKDFINLKKEEQTIIYKIVQFFKKLLSNFNKQLKKELQNKEFINKIDEIVYNINEKNYNIFDKYNKNDFKLYTLEETIETQNKKDNGKVLKLMQFISENKGVITGSLALRDYITLFRKEIEPIHDIDVKINYLDLNPYTTYSELNFETSELYIKLKEKYKNDLYFFSKWENEDEDYKASHYYITTTEIHKKIEIQRNKNQTLANSYETLTKEEKEKTILLDFFIHKQKINYNYNEEYKINLTEPSESFIPKIMIMGRTKDIFDYQNMKYKSNSRFQIEDKRNYLYQLAQNSETDFTTCQF